MNHEPHPSREALARLVDEAPHGPEASHLARCPECRRELEALRAQTQALGRLSRLPPDPAGPPPVVWESIEAELDREPRRRPPSLGRWGRAAAALLLFCAGVAVGDAMAGESTPSGTARALPRDQPSASVGPAPPATTAQSEALVRLTEGWYLAALAEHRALLEAERGMEPESDPMGRLVLTEAILAATEAAVRRAPSDPFFNGLLANTTIEHRAAMEGVRRAMIGPNR